MLDSLYYLSPHTCHSFSLEQFPYFLPLTYHKPYLPFRCFLRVYLPRYNFPDLPSHTMAETIEVPVSWHSSHLYLFYVCLVFLLCCSVLMLLPAFVFSSFFKAYILIPFSFPIFFLVICSWLPWELQFLYYGNLKLTWIIFKWNLIIPCLYYLNNTS